MSQAPHQIFLKMIENGDVEEIRKFLQDPKNAKSIADLSKAGLDAFVARTNSLDTRTASRSSVDRAMMSRTR